LTAVTLAVKHVWSKLEKSSMFPRCTFFLCLYFYKRCIISLKLPLFYFETISKQIEDNTWVCVDTSTSHSPTAKTHMRYKVKHLEIFCIYKQPCAIVYIFSHLYRVLCTGGNMLDINWLQAAKALVEFNRWWNF